MIGRRQRRGLADCKRARRCRLPNTLVPRACPRVFLGFGLSMHRCVAGDCASCAWRMVMRIVCE